MKYYSKTHKGNVRRSNEDSIFVGDYFAVVADGMGGHNAGDVASKLIVDSIENSLINIEADEITTKDIKKAIIKANKEVWSNAKHNPHRNGMGSTATLAVFKDSKVFIGQVGDSRAYIFSDNELRQITKDHSYVQELVDAGKITKKEAENHPRRNIITRAMGTNIDIQSDFYVLDVKTGDVILLCSDGLISCVDDKEISKILEKDISSAVDSLVNAALDCGGYDNISVILAVVEDDII